MFLTIGKYWARGVLPYVGLWDSKGPAIFFINALGYLLLGSRFGVFLIQIVFLSFTIYFSYQLFYQVFSWRKAALLTLLMLFSITYFFSKGNTTEEYALPFLSASFLFLYQWSREMEEGRYEHKPVHAAVYGACLGLCLLTRLTNAIGLCAAVAYVCICLAVHGKWKNLGMNALAFVAGFLLLALPFVLYFAANGALGEMWYGTILYNLEYAQASGMNTEIYSPLYLTLAAAAYVNSYGLLLIGLWMLVFQRKRRKSGLMWILVAGITCVWFLKGILYFHYPLVALPCFCIGVNELYMCARENRDRKTVQRLTAIALSGFLLVAVLGGAYGAYDYGKGFIEGLRYPQTSEAKPYPILDMIPESERDSFVAYNCQTGLYLQTDIQPCYRFFTLQYWAGYMGNSLNARMAETFAGCKAKWILMGDKTQKVQPEVQAILDAHYRCVSTDGTNTLYRLIEE